MLGPHRADPGRRRRAPHDRPVRRRVHPGHALGAARVRRGVPHARRARSCTPATSRSTSRRSTAAAPTWPASARSRAAASGRKFPGVAPLRLHQRRASRVHAVGVDRRAGDARRCSATTRTSGSSSPASRRTCTGCSRSPRPRSPAGASVAFVGRSMVQQRDARARDGPARPVPSNRVIDIEEAPRYSPGEVCIICTGSQGEPMSALSLMAAHEHKWVKISEDDVVVISAHAIPGQRDQRDPRDRLAVPRRRRGRARRQRAGARLRPRVAGRAEVHDEPRCSPEWFVPVHGEYRHMVHHARPRGAVRRRVRQGVRLRGRRRRHARSTTALEVERRAVPAGYLYVDGIVGDIGQGVLRDRRNLAEEGVVVVIVTVDAAHRRDRHRARDRDARAGSTHPRPRSSSRTRRTRCGRRSRTPRSEGATDFETPAPPRPARARAGSSTSAPAAGRR